MKKIVILFLLILLGIAPLLAQTLSGHVRLQGSSNHALATVRIEQLGIGSTAKLDGAYRITGIKPGKHTVEYSFVGYKTVQKEITFTEGKDEVCDVELEEHPIALNPVFITPDGSDPARYIMNQVWANAQRKYNANKNYHVTSTTVLSFRDLDIVSDFLPRPIKRVLMMMAAVVGMRAPLKLIFDHPNLDVATTNQATCKGGKYKWGKEKIKSCNEQLTPKEIDVLNKFGVHEDLYKTVYVENLLRNKKAQLKLKGTYMDGNDLVYIVEAVKGSKREAMHVIDGKWDVTRYIVYDGSDDTIVEMRKALGDLYMPVSMNLKLVLIKMSPEEIKKMMEETPEETRETNEKSGRMMNKEINRIEKDKERKERIQKMMQRVLENGLETTLSFGATLKYHK